jgi:hypothetical protein
LASVTGRIGYGWDRFLGYVKAGGAWGIGGEYAFTDWLSGFVEYDYYNFGTQSTTLVTTAATLPIPVNIKAYDNVFKVGLNLRRSPGPVVARY